MRKKIEEVEDEARSLVLADIQDAQEATRQKLTALSQTLNQKDARIQELTKQNSDLETANRQRTSSLNDLDRKTELQSVFLYDKVSRGGSGVNDLTAVFSR